MSFSNFFDYDKPESAGQELSEVDLTFWSARSAADWKKFLGVTQTLRFGPGEKVIQAGSSETGFYIVSYGRFERLGVEHQEGELIGLLSFFDGQPYDADVSSVGNGELIHVSHTALDTFAALEPQLARAVLMELGRILAASYRKK